MNKLGQYIEIDKAGILPSFFPDELFYYYSLPDYDSNGLPSLSLGKNINSNKFLIQNKRILISKLNPRIKRVWKVINNEKYRSISSTEFVVLNPKEIEFDFLYYLLQAEEIYQKLEANAIGSTNSHTRFNPNLISSLEAYIPAGQSTQRKIARILSTTDTVIEKTQAAIAKYKAIKQGMLQDLFTSGIDTKTGKLRPKHEDAPELYKESKSGWIPKEWEVEKLGNYCDRISVGIATSSSEYFATEGVLFLRNQNIKVNGIDLKDITYVTKEFADANSSKYLKCGDVITVRTGYPGISAVVPKELEDSQTFTTLITTPNKKHLNSYFLSYFINSDFGRVQVLNLQGGGAQQNLNSGALETMLISKPTIKEQDLIVKKLKAIESKMSSEQTYLQKLQYIKAGLMADLLSGKKEVTVEEELQN